MDMTKHTNISQELVTTARRQQHYGIRKLTIGVTSVLLGTTLWLGGKANVARADVQNDNDETPHQATQSDRPSSQIDQNTRVEVQAAKATESRQNSTNQISSDTGKNIQNNTLQTASINQPSLNMVGEEKLKQEKISNSAGQKDLDEAAQEVAKAREEAEKAREEAARKRAEAEAEANAARGQQQFSSSSQEDSAPSNQNSGKQSNYDSTNTDLPVSESPRNDSVSPTDPVTPVNPTAPAPEEVTATINYFDQTENQLIKRDQLTGEVGETISDKINPEINTLTNQGYVLVNTLPANTVLKDSANNYRVDFVHGTETVSVNNPGKPGQLINPNNPNGPRYPEGTGLSDLEKIGTQIVHYTGAGSQTPSDNIKQFTFYRTITIDKITETITSSSPWNDGSIHTFNSVNTPVVDGYHADRRNAGGLTITPDNLRKEVTVTYSRNGRIIPTDSFTQEPIPGAAQPIFQTDIQDATKVKPMTVPTIAGYTPQISTVTASNPSKDVSVLYNKINNSSVAIHLNDVDPNAWKDIIPVKRELAKVITIPGVAGRKIDFSTAQLPDGFEFAGSLPNGDFFGQTSNITLNVKHRTTDVSLTDPSATKIVKETITVINPDKTKLDLSQSIQLHRSAVYDQVTHLTSYGQWNSGHFNVVNIPIRSGYTASQTSIPAVNNVTINYIDPHLKVAYTSNAGSEGSAVVNFVDGTGHLVGNDIVYGRKGSTATVTAQVPDGCDIKTPNQRVTFSSNGQSSQAVIAEITPHISVISADAVKKASVWGTNRHSSSDADVLSGTKAKHAKRDITYGDLNDQKTRTVIIVRPDNTIDPHSTVQKLNLQRSARVNALTGDVSYTNWTPVNRNTFSPVNIPQIAGYTASLIQVPASAKIDGSYQDPHIVVTYKANPTRNRIVYQDDKGNKVGQQDVAGVTGQKVNLQLSIPDGYQVREAPEQVTLQAGDQPITVSVKPVTETFSPDQVTVSKPISAKTIITGTKTKHLKQDITYNDLHKDVRRTINIVRPDGSLDPTSPKQVVHFVRNAEVNAVTGNITYGQWKPINSTTLGAVDLPAIPGYTAADEVRAITVNPTDTDSTVKVTYIPEEESQTVVYRDENGNIVGQQIVKGKTGQIIKPVLNIPDGYKIAANAQLPTNIAIEAQSKPLNIQVKSKVVHIKASDVTSNKPFSKETIIPGTINKHALQDINYHDLHKEVGRQIVLTLPSGQKQTINQSVHFQREAEIDASTGKVSFGAWQVSGNDQLAAVKLRSIAGYIPSSNILEVDDVDSNENFEPLKVTYLADTPANRLIAAAQNTKNQAQAKQRMEAKLAKLQQDQVANNDRSLTTKQAIEDQKKKVLQAQAKLQQDIKRENILKQDKKLRDKDDQAKKVLQDIKDQISDLTSQQSSLQGQIKQQEKTEDLEEQTEEKAKAAYDQLDQKINQLQATIDSFSAIAKIDLKLTPTTITKYDSALETYRNVISEYENKYDDTIENNEERLKSFQDDFAAAIKKPANDLLQALYDIYPQEKANIVWNDKDSKEAVYINNLTSEQKKQIDDFTLELLNTIRHELGIREIPAFVHSDRANQMAQDIAERYLKDGNSLLNLEMINKEHDCDAVNEVAKEYHLQPSTGEEQDYESTDAFPIDGTLTFVESDSKKSGSEFWPTDYNGKENNYGQSDPNIAAGKTNLDSIKQGIFQNVLMMLLKDNTGTNNWDHTAHLLSLFDKTDRQSKKPEYYFGGASMGLLTPEILREKHKNAGKDELEKGQYTNHFIAFNSSNIDAGHTFESDSRASKLLPSLDDIYKAQQNLAVSKNQLSAWEAELAGKKDAWVKATNKVKDDDKVLQLLKSDLEVINSKLLKLDPSFKIAQANETAADKALQDYENSLAAAQNSVDQDQQDLQNDNQKLDGLNEQSDADAKQGQSLIQKMDQYRDDNLHKEQKGESQTDNQTEAQNSEQTDLQNNDADQITNGQSGSALTQSTAEQNRTTSTSSSLVNEASSPNDNGSGDSYEGLGSRKTENNKSKASRQGHGASASVSTTNNKNSLARRRGKYYAAMAAPKGLKGIRETSQSGKTLKIANTGHLGKQKGLNSLPQTGENQDSLFDVLAGATSLSIALIGLAGTKRKREVQYLKINGD